ncbi:hypothetical protein Y032_0162g3414 [Ancylostoma ceylanicum]|nr:hypothetical protein Y032_0162g3414 [Ancylostoma ceylanicum]
MATILARAARLRGALVEAVDGSPPSTRTVLQGGFCLKMSRNTIIMPSINLQAGGSTTTNQKLLTTLENGWSDSFDKCTSSSTFHLLTSQQLFS